MDILRPVALHGPAAERRAEVRDYGRGPELAAITIALLGLCWISVGLRSYTMRILMKRFSASDWLAVVTLVLYSAYSAIILLGVHFGLGAHVADVSLVDQPKALFWKWAGQVGYIVISVLVKFVAGLLLLRLCVGHRWQRVVIRIILIFTVLYNAFYIIITIFQCRPIEFYWHRYDVLSDITGQCNDTDLATIPTYISFITSIITDWTLALIPISMVWHANLERRVKVSVSCVLALGSLASLATIVRIPFARQVLSNPDYLYNFTDLAIWSTVELGLGLTASSLATLKPLFRKIRFFNKTENASKASRRSRRSLGKRRVKSTSKGVQSISVTGAPDVEIFDGRPTSDQIELKYTWESLGSVTTTITATPHADEDDIIAPVPPSFRGHVTRTMSISFSEAHEPAFMEVPDLSESPIKRKPEDMV
ncbi:cation-transporting ATPase 4 [Xylariomycetidae sp. FL0641]|nr:cation-transporting ATPase 4 [Xylariomycetidae sp. FL0641]